MNAPHKHITGVTGNTYVMTLSDFPDGARVEDGIATGVCARGDLVSVPLDTPICIGCDTPLTSSNCDLCEVIHLDLVASELKSLGNGIWRAEA